MAGGVLVPVAVLTAFRLRIFTIASEWLLFVWPTSIMLMATDSMERGSAEARSILTLSVAWNVALYVVVFLLIWCVAWVLAAWKVSLRDGTTI
jgi:hypothetical protein